MRLTRIFSALVAAMMILPAVNSAAQDLQTKEEFSARYNLLAGRLGAAGVGIETLLDKWETAYPDDTEMCMARFSYYYSKCRTSQTISSKKSKYLGNAPALTLKDTAGVAVNYFEDYLYDDEIFGKATSYLDKAINVAPTNLAYRLVKASALFEYEKESPDMTLSFLKGLVDYNAQSKPKWIYPDVDEVTSDDFDGLVQDYCVSLMQLGTDQGWEAFKALSEKMLQYSPKNTIFMTNLGSYSLVYKKDHKTALKQYQKVLKIQPNDYAAIKNCVLLARDKKDVKLEKKYLPMLIKNAETDLEKQQAQVRLEQLNK